jgi:cytochrome b involved in lipid metabolism
LHVRNAVEGSVVRLEKDIDVPQTVEHSDDFDAFGDLVQPRQAIRTTQKEIWTGQRQLAKARMTMARPHPNLWAPLVLTNSTGNDASGILNGAYIADVVSA